MGFSIQGNPEPVKKKKKKKKKKKIHYNNYLILIHVT